MIRRFSLLAATALLAFTTSPAAAGEKMVGIRTVSGALTLDRAVEIALRQNPEILKQLQEIERTHGQVIEIRAQALPRVTLAGNFTQQDRRLIGGGGGAGGSINNGNSVIILPSTTTDTGTGGGGGTGAGGAPGETPDFSELLESLGGNDGAGPSGPSDKSYRVAIEARQVLYAGGQVRAALKIARFTQDSSLYQLRNIIDLIIARTRQQFYNVLLTRALIKVQEESIQLLTDQLKDQQNRFEAGTVPRFNVLRAEVELSNARPELIRARNNYLIGRLELAKTLGLDAGPEGQRTITGGAPLIDAVGELTVKDRPMRLSDALAMARERRPFLKVQRQTILIQKEQIKVELAGYKPRLEASGGYEVRNSSLTDELDRTVDGWFYGITGTWNIFDGFETYGRVKQARALLESARINYDDSVQQVDLEVQQAYANLQAARETIRSQQKNVEQALEALRLANERLGVGAGTQLDVLDARVALTQARTTELQARADYNTNLAEFDRVTATDTIYDDTFEDPLAHPKRKRAAEPRKTAPKKR